MSTPISEHMTLQPHTIGKDQPLSKASALMREHTIRHLPVLHGGQLLGILSNRDVYLVESLNDVDPDTVTVEEAMTPDPYSVTPEVALVDVVGRMAEKKYGAAVVMNGREVAGIFTTIDALRLLGERL
ncbi:MAG: CBS domain-containing protein [Sandaracinaceae bacterium]